ncbi:Neurotransmitter-gated ion-channel transmembrane region [Oesophagostomum dentatum]|uniref:Neurotransmitter-gated ion-channel transmembrane region n=1 Tax=Oesophagostomum dentatum TaxID=61180 RepID=A0A0B1TSL5_OESDE|nr:Neurotransmitter-gated ion-channel transmembrane region [Oesophagostomum dentatum]
MHRRPMFYVFNHIIPCVLISSMAVLGFLMPPETGEKVNMIITTLLSMGVYLQSITESIPPTSEAVPLIGIYYVSSLSIVCLATCVNVITLNIHRNGAISQGRHIPRWMEKWVLGYLASFMRMTIKEPDSKTLLGKVQGRKSDLRNNSLFYDWKTSSPVDYRKQGVEQFLGDGCGCMGVEKMDASPNFTLNNSTTNNNIAYGQLNGKPAQNLSEDLFMGNLFGEQILSRIAVCRPAVSFEGHFRRVLRRLYRSLEQHEIREEIIDERQRIRWQWQHLASVVDRLLLVLFSSATLFTITFFLVLPVGMRSEQL